MERDPSSFRDPAGYIFHSKGQLFRRVNLCYKKEYDYLKSSGLYKELVDRKLLVSHEEVRSDEMVDDDTYLTLKPMLLPFISYPYEWSFSQLQSAALLTLEVQRVAFKFGMCLKDASAFNIQFIGSSPILIDTLSFEIYKEGQPWKAYKQFCQHFFAPLVLSSFVDPRLGMLSKNFIDGIPLDLSFKLLPWKTVFFPSVFIHIFLHTRAQQKFSDSQGRNSKPRPVSRLGIQGLIDNLKVAVERRVCRNGKTEWGQYYENTNYSDSSLELKKQLLESFCKKVSSKFKIVLDLGANTGKFSEVLAKSSDCVVSADVDCVAVEVNYLQRVKQRCSKILPLIIDLTNPSPNLGWDNTERGSFFSRTDRIELTIALALIHHLAISNNISLRQLSVFFSKISPFLIIEFVPKSDSQVKRLLASREDIFPSYNVEGFEKAFSSLYTIESKSQISGTDRTLYLLKRR